MEYTVYDCLHTDRRRITANSLEELLLESKEKLGYYSTDATLVLAEDGTVVDEEEYFQCLDANTDFVLLKNSEQWIPFHGSACIGYLVNKLKRNLGYLLVFSTIELQLLVDTTSDSLSEAMNIPHDEALLMQEGCQRALNEKREFDEILQFIIMLKREINK